MAQEYQEPYTITAKYGLAYVYWAILFSLLAFISVLIWHIKRRTLICLGYALLLTVALIVASLFSVIAKTVSGLPLLEPLVPSWFTWFFNNTFLGVILSPIILFFCFISICYAPPIKKIIDTILNA